MFPHTLLLIMKPAYTFSTAPMMEWTDRHWRVFARVLTKKALLYTEMITAKALIYGDLEQLTQHSKVEYPLAIQIGGSEPDDLYRAVTLVRDRGYQEINFNIGCPSGRVQSGHFGAALMADEIKTAECLSAMRSAVFPNGPEITAKIRLGIDDQIIEDTLPKFIDKLEKSKISRIIIHARKAILKGLSPKQNRDIPPLNYSMVYALKDKYPKLRFILNGGLKTINDCISHLNGLDGVMIGRAAYQTPLELLQVDQLIFGINPPSKDAEQALKAYQPYIDEMLTQGVPLKHLSRHLVGLYHNVPGAKKFRQILSEEAHKSHADWRVVQRAMSALETIEK